MTDRRTSDQQGAADLNQATFKVEISPTDGFRLEFHIPDCVDSTLSNTKEIRLPASTLKPYSLPAPEEGLSQGSEEFQEKLATLEAEVSASGPSSVVSIPYPQSLREQIREVTGDKNRIKSLPLEAIAIHPHYQAKNLKSRRDARLETNLTRNIKIAHPIYPAEMQAVMNEELAEVLVAEGVWPMCHRYFGHDYQFQFVGRFPDKCLVSCGTREFKDPQTAKRELKTLRQLLDSGALGVCIDVTQGDNYYSLWACEQLKESHPEKDVILANIVTFDGTLRAIRAGADAVKVGMGPGSPCTTRGVTRVGVGQATAIATCAAAARPFGVPIIADGGIKNTGDLHVCLALGASCGMSGQLYSKTEESAAGRKAKDRRFTKEPGRTAWGRKLRLVRTPRAIEVLYFGEASESAWDRREISVSQGMEPEGEAVWTSVDYTVKQLLTRFSSAALSFLTLAGCRSIEGVHKLALSPINEPVVSIVPESYGREAAIRRL